MNQASNTVNALPHAGEGTALQRAQAGLSNEDENGLSPSRGQHRHPPVQNDQASSEVRSGSELSIATNSPATTDSRAAKRMCVEEKRNGITAYDYALLVVKMEAPLRGVS